MASHMAQPREGHLECALHLFSYLKINHNSHMAFNPSYPSIDVRPFKECDWVNFYGDVEEAVPPKAPEARGKEVDLRMFVDSDHAGDKRTRRSRSGFLIYLNMAPIVWVSCRQATIKTSVFGA